MMLAQARLIKGYHVVGVADLNIAKARESLQRVGWEPEQYSAKTLADAYTLAGNANQALVIPAGLAFARSIAKRPDVNLYVADKRHPSPEGSYLAAATTYAALFNKSPVGLKFSASIKPDVAAHLQQVAWDTVQQYLGR